MKLYDARVSLRAFRILVPAYIKAIFRPLPIWTHLYVTRKCNLNCKYCFVRDPSKRDMNEEELKKVIDHLYYLGCRFLSFFGGEPTIRKDFLKLVKYAHDKGMITHVSTNGILLTPRYINKLGKTGIDMINLSVDSILEFDDSKKDYTRNKKVLADLINARKKFHFEISVNFVLTNKNIDNVISTIKLLNEYKIPISIAFIIKNTYSKMKQEKSLFFRTKKEKEKLFNVLDEIKKLKKDGYNIIDPMQYFDDIKKFMNHKLNWYCAAGEYYLSVDSDGKFQICAGLPAEEISIFDVNRDYFKKFAELRSKRLARCKRICLSNCLYDTSYFIKHPLYFIRELF